MNGYYIIELSDQSDFQPSTALDFAHEYGHILSNYYQTFNTRHAWFDESIASLVSIFALTGLDRELSQRATQYQVYISETGQLYEIYGKLRQNMSTLVNNSEVGEVVSRADFRDWYWDRAVDFEQEAYDKTANAFVARNLLDIFHRKSGSVQCLALYEYAGAGTLQYSR